MASLSPTWVRIRERFERGTDALGNGIRDKLVSLSEIHGDLCVFFEFFVVGLREKGWKEKKRCYENLSRTQRNSHRRN